MILLMVQNSGDHRLGYIKPYKYWEFNYQPQLVSGSRISNEPSPSPLAARKNHPFQVTPLKCQSMAFSWVEGGGT